MASPEAIDSIWNDDLPWGEGHEADASTEELVVLTLLPAAEEPMELTREGWASRDWS